MIFFGLVGSPIKKVQCSQRAGEREVYVERESEPKPCGRGGEGKHPRRTRSYSLFSTQTTTGKEKKIRSSNPSQKKRRKTKIRRILHLQGYNTHIRI
jgi:hypothetical protein